MRRTFSLHDNLILKNCVLTIIIIIIIIIIITANVLQNYCLKAEHFVSRVINISNETVRRCSQVQL